MTAAVTTFVWLVNVFFGLLIGAVVWNLIFPLFDQAHQRWRERSAMWKALKAIREAGGNDNQTARWMQSWAAWGMEPGRWPKPAAEYPPRR